MLTTETDKTRQVSQSVNERIELPPTCQLCCWSINVRIECDTIQKNQDETRMVRILDINKHMNVSFVDCRFEMKTKHSIWVINWFNNFCALFLSLFCIYICNKSLWTESETKPKEQFLFELPSVSRQVEMPKIEWCETFKVSTKYEIGYLYLEQRKMARRQPTNRKKKCFE